MRVTFSYVPYTERKRVRRQLERYCGRDKEGMLWIAEALRRAARSKSYRGDSSKMLC